MIIEIPNENSIVKWKNNEKDEWKSAEISDLIKAYERSQGKWIMQRHDLDGEFYTCSICGRMIRVSPYVEDNETLKDYPFCHCGAEMRGGVE